MKMTDAFDSHDHDACVHDALEAAERSCAEQSLRMTPVRRRVLEILLETHNAQGAYEILERLSAEGLGSKPPVVYRALAFLTENGFAHRVERLNAFVACASPGSHHAPAFMICRGCGSVAEDRVADGGGLASAVAKAGFQVEQTVVEIEGLCPTCQE